MDEVEIQRDTVKFTEMRDGTKGTGYWYVATNEGFIPVGLFNGAEEEFIKCSVPRHVATSFIYQAFQI
jgi:hypothetical protein